MTLVAIMFVTILSALVLFALYHLGHRAIIRRFIECTLCFVCLLLVYVVVRDAFRVL